MEALDKLEARKSLRFDMEQLSRPVVVNSFDDIKRVVHEYDPRRNIKSQSIPLSTLMQVVEDNKNITYKVDASTRSKSKREIIVEGLDVIKARINAAQLIVDMQESVEINGVEMKPAKLGYQTNGTSWVDPLIRQWFGGYRDGVMICWKLSDGYIYRYDVYDHKLTRILANEAASKVTTAGPISNDK